MANSSPGAIVAFWTFVIVFAPWAFALMRGRLPFAKHERTKGTGPDIAPRFPAGYGACLPPHGVFPVSLARAAPPAVSGTIERAARHEAGMNTTEAAYTDIPGVAIQVSRDIVVASIQVDLDDSVLARFREDLLRRIHETGSRGVILDVSGLETLDSDEFASLRRVITMSAIMGAESVLVGLRPGVVSALVEAGADVDGLRAAINLDAAFALLQPEPEPEPESEVEAEADADREDGLPLEPEQDVLDER
jgi:rsbT antagonist protein RsbS